MSFSDIVMSHSDYRAQHPRDAAYDLMIGGPETCPGYLRREDEYGTLRCDRCHYGVVPKPTKAVRADQYVADPEKSEWAF
jgi:hypothetical protein